MSFGMKTSAGNEAVRQALEEVYGIEDRDEAIEFLRTKLSIISIEFPEVVSCEVRQSISDIMGPVFEEILV